METRWAFMPNFDPARRKRLEAFDTFEKVVEAIGTNCEIREALVQEGTDLGPQGCWRPSVKIIVDHEIFDAFFNSPGGYRAQYLASPENGQAANGKLLAYLEPQLSAAVLKQCGQSHLSQEWIQNSFLANSAKIWPDEEELNFIDATIDLQVDKWRKHCEWINAPSDAGLWAPIGTQLMAFGAFIDPWGNEVISRKKIRRRFDIHECGYS